MRDTGERQLAPTLDGIRKDHTARYRWAAKLLKGMSVLDCGCGIGYGSKILAGAGCRITACDKSADAIRYAKKHYADLAINFDCCDLTKLENVPRFDAAVAFEVIEHLEDPRPLLRALRTAVPLLLASVPNEEVFPYADHAFHHRHYTREQFAALLSECGWLVDEWHGQIGVESPVRPDTNGRTLIACCVPAGFGSKVPKTVAIVGLGPSKHEYVSAACGAGDRHKLFEQTWAINAAGSVIEHDLLFHMDDMKVQEIRAAANPDGNIAALVAWLKSHDKPIMTSRAYADYPATTEIPVEAMINDLTYDYFNNTAAWAMAYAIHLGVEKVGLFGCDYTYKDRHDAEKGRACLEFWMGYAAARGIRFILPASSTIMDACEPRQERLYGFDTRRVILSGTPGQFRVSFEEIEPPTAEEMEWRYDHNRHPNSLAEEIETA